MAKRKQGYQQAYYNHEAEWILEIPINKESGRGYRPERGDSTIREPIPSHKRLGIFLYSQQIKLTYSKIAYFKISVFAQETKVLLASPMFHHSQTHRTHLLTRIVFGFCTLGFR